MTPQHKYKPDVVSKLRPRPLAPNDTLHSSMKDYSVDIMSIYIPLLPRYINKDTGILREDYFCIVSDNNDRFVF